MPPVAIVPAAGKGERFGGAKLTALVDGATMLDRTLASLLDGGVGRIVVVVAPSADFGRVERLSDRRVQTVVNDDPSRGMFSSIQAGLAVAGGDPVLVVPADMPFVSPATVAAVAEACVRDRTIVVPIYQGDRGHPIAFPAALHRAVLDAPVTSTLKDALAATGARRIELPVDDPGILRDVDAPGDLGFRG
jgi:molybdenum cofactor cytidylyltransferase